MQAVRRDSCQESAFLAVLAGFWFQLIPSWRRICALQRRRQDRRSRCQKSAAPPWEGGQQTSKNQRERHALFRRRLAALGAGAGPSSAWGQWTRIGPGSCGKHSL
jgi:hypothetical protein